MIFGALILGVMSGLAFCLAALFSGTSLLGAVQVYLVASTGTAFGVLALKALYCLAVRALDSLARKPSQGPRAEWPPHR